MPKNAPATPPRPWYWDALAAFAFWALALAAGKGVSRAFGPFGGLFFFLFTAGLGWMFGRAAWRGYLARRGR